MSGDTKIPSKIDRPALPRDAFRTQRSSGMNPGSTTAAKTMTQMGPVVVMPDYSETPSVRPIITGPASAAGTVPEIPADKEDARTIARSGRNPFESYGGRSKSRPYAFRLPDPIDLVLRQLAAEERTHPLRIIDQILHDHLQQIGRLPQPD